MEGPILAFILKYLPFLKYLGFLTRLADSLRKKQEISHEVIETETLDIELGNATRYRHTRQRTERSYRRDN